MKKHKSKSNILSHQKIKQHTNTIPSNPKNIHQHKQTPKTITTVKPNKNSNKDHTNNKILQTKSKSKLQKITSYSSKYDDKINYQSLINKQRRNSSSIVSHRPISRMSTKRGSVASNKQKPQQNKINEKLKQNDHNYINFQDNQNLENQNIINDLKKSIQNTKSKKKLSLNIHIKPRTQLEIHKDNLKKQKKNGKIHQFEKKMSKYLNQKDIFSEQFLHQNCQEKIKQNKQSKNSSKQKQKQEEKHYMKNQNNERQNLLQIYQFYKKTFDINLNNCMKKSTNTTKIEKSKNSSSKSIVKPSNSSAIISHDKCGKVTDYKAQLKQRKNYNQILTNNKSILNKQKKNELRSKCEKQILLLSQIQKSHLLESRSKSKNSMAHSESSTKDNIFGCHAEIESSDNIKETSLTLNKSKKKSYKQLIIFNENKVMSHSNECRILMKQTNNQLQINKNKIEVKVNQNIIKDNKKQHFSKDKNSQKEDLKNIQIGQSNIDVLNWWQNGKRQSSTLQNQLKIKQTSIYKDYQNLQQESKDLNQKIIIRNQIQQKNNENKQTQHLQKNSIKIQKIQQQNYNFGIQIIKSQIVQNIKFKQKQDQEVLSSLADLSSISVIYDKKSFNQQQNSPNINFKLQIQDVPLDL